MRKDTLATRNLLISTAEKLFAEQGVESTSLFDIFKASGLKNRSVLQYHFKDKPGLINAVLSKHSEGVALNRAQMLGKIEKNPDYSIHDVVEAIVMPMAALIDKEDGGPEYLQLHSQLMISKQYSGLRLEREERQTEAHKIYTLINPKLSANLSKDQLQSRWIMVDCLLIHSLASYSSKHSDLNRETFLQTLIQAIVGLLLQK